MDATKPETLAGAVAANAAGDDPVIQPAAENAEVTALVRRLRLLGYVLLLLVIAIVALMVWKPVL